MKYYKSMYQFESLSSSWGIPMATVSLSTLALASMVSPASNNTGLFCCEVVVCGLAVWVAYAGVGDPVGDGVCLVESRISSALRASARRRSASARALPGRGPGVDRDVLACPSKSYPQLGGEGLQHLRATKIPKTMLETALMGVLWELRLVRCLWTAPIHALKKKEKKTYCRKSGKKVYKAKVSLRSPWTPSCHLKNRIHAHATTQPKFTKLYTTSVWNKTKDTIVAAVKIPSKFFTRIDTVPPKTCTRCSGIRCRKATKKLARTPVIPLIW